jgi:hypothetical protein
MTIDDNNYVEAALETLKDQIDDIHDLMQAIWKAHLFGSSSGDMNELASLLITARDTVEIFQNYDGTYDRIERWCWGRHPGRYEVQCRLCEVQQLCWEETASRETRAFTLWALWPFNRLRRLSEHSKSGIGPLNKQS